MKKNLKHSIHLVILEKTQIYNTNHLPQIPDSTEAEKIEILSGCKKIDTFFPNLLILGEVTVNFYLQKYPTKVA